MIIVRDYLLKHGIRPSIQRIAVMDYLMHHFTHPTVDEIYSDLIDKIPTLSRTTIYNTLKLLVSHDAVAAIDIDRTCERFDANTQLHAHMMCDSCGCIIDIPVVDSSAFLSLAPADAQIRSINMNFKGLCPRCSKQKSC